MRAGLLGSESFELEMNMAEMAMSAFESFKKDDEFSPFKICSGNGQIRSRKTREGKHFGTFSPCGQKKQGWCHFWMGILSCDVFPWEDKIRDV